MTRLPTIGGDDGNWGAILNDYLQQSHSDDGNLKAGSVGAQQLRPNSVTGVSIADGAISNAKISDGTITNTKLSSVGVANGLATLAADAKIAETQLPLRLSDDELTEKISALIDASSDDVVGRPLGGALVTLGDSTIAGGAQDVGISTATSTRFQDAWPIIAAISSQQKFWIAKHAGIWGNTTSQMIARFETDVTPHNPDMVAIMTGRNDPDVAATVGGVTTLVGKTRAIGALPILCIPLPTNTTNGGHKARMAATAIALRVLARTLRVPVIDFYALATDPSTGDMKTAYYAHDTTDSTAADGIHPGNAGIKLMGEYAAPILAGLASPDPVQNAVGPETAGNLCTNPFFEGITDPTNTGFTTGGWSIGSKPTAGFETFSLTTVDGWRGNALDLVTIPWANVAPAAVIRRTVAASASTFAVGDIVEYSGKVRVLANTLPAGVRVQAVMLFEGNGMVNTAVDTNKTITGAFRLRMRVPAGTTAIRMFASVPPNSTGAAHVQIGEINLRNLTKLGIT